MSVALYNRLARAIEGSESSIVSTDIRDYPRWEGRILGLLVFMISLTIGYLLVFKYHVVYGDAMSRALSGLYTVLRPQFHLAAAGFLWNPLPSLLSIPFAAVRSIWPPLMQYGFAANIISAGFSAVGVYHMNRLLWRFGFGRTARVLWYVLYMANPMMLLYGGNGMTDGMMSAVVVACGDNLVGYLKSGTVLELVKSATWLAAGFMVRYESVPIGAGIGLGLAIVVFRRERSWAKAESAAITFWFPVVCAGFSWIFLNWMIMKNPLYFASSRYSNTVQLSSGLYNTPAVIAARHNLGVSLSQVLRFTGLFWPFVPAALAVLVMQLRRRADPIGLPLLLGSLGAPLLQVILLYSHRSADWARFFIYYIPFGFMLCGYLASLVGPSARRWIPLVLCLVLSSADVVTLTTMRSPVWGNGDNWAVSEIATGRVDPGGPQNIWPAIVAGARIANYFNSRPDLKILISSFTSYAVIPYINDPHRIIFTADPNFKAVLLNPRGRVNAILAPPVNSFTKASDAITGTYPTLWSGGVPWTRLIKEFPGGDRLYAVLPSAP